MLIEQRIPPAGMIGVIPESVPIDPFGPLTISNNRLPPSGSLPVKIISFDAAPLVNTVCGFATGGLLAKKLATNTLT